MSERNPGIFNPYQKPLPKVQRKDYSLDREMSLAEEVGLEEPESNVRLDGGSFVLELTGVEIEEVGARLGELIKDVAERYREHLFDNGVQLSETGKPFEVEEGEMVLPTPSGNLIVYVGTDGDEDSVYRRISKALYNLPIQNILEKHKARVIARS